VLTASIFRSHRSHDRGNEHSWNVCRLLPDCTAQHPRNCCLYARHRENLKSYQVSCYYLYRDACRGCLSGEILEIMNEWMTLADCTEQVVLLKMLRNLSDCRKKKTSPFRIRRFITVFTKAWFWFVLWARSILSTINYFLWLRIILIISSKIQRQVPPKLSVPCRFSDRNYVFVTHNISSR
jgi:predicted Fe-S protein YdhL (DUF1289 family)